ncbi:hypothetical protein M733_05305 [Neisseria gonorrhoeae ATL_2011_05-13]|nr:hypothetical protein M733_05305 [Neisseria gonorrhoeae ATL_2011_05-13]
MVAQADRMPAANTAKLGLTICLIFICRILFYPMPVCLLFGRAASGEF